MKHTLKVTLILTTLFFIAQMVGLAITDAYIDQAATETRGEVTWQELPTIAGMQVERPDLAPNISVWYISIALLVGTLLILVIIRFGKMFLWKLWFFLAITLCLQIALAAFLPDWIALVLAILLAILKLVKPNVITHNLTELFIYGGLAVIFVPILNVVYAFVLLIILSGYDMYAVWRSKHMVHMAKFQAKSGIFAGLLFPYKIKGKGKRRGTVKTAVLGGGDIGFPLIFAGVVMKTTGYLDAVVVAVFATLGLFALLYFSKKDRFYPAMPFLTIGCSLGYVVSLLV